MTNCRKRHWTPLRRGRAPRSQLEAVIASSSSTSSSAASGAAGGTRGGGTGGAAHDQRTKTASSRRASRKATAWHDDDDLDDGDGGGGGDEAAAEEEDDGGDFDGGGVHASIYRRKGELGAAIIGTNMAAAAAAPVRRSGRIPVRRQYTDDEYEVESGGCDSDGASASAAAVGYRPASTLAGVAEEDAEGDEMAEGERIPFATTVAEAARKHSGDTKASVEWVTGWPASSGNPLDAVAQLTKPRSAGALLPPPPFASALRSGRG